jgi:phenylpyruvate tautomerase PptA (4-oxalocrotonate tautomerase family)
MPTYTVRLPVGLLTDNQKVKMANAITARHSEFTGAPTFFVQVIIDEDVHAQRFIGGSPAGDHIWVNGDLRGGRTSEQIALLMTALMDDISTISGLPAESVWIYINEIEPDHMIEFGEILPMPGEEAEWFLALPPHVREALEALGIEHSKFML